MKNKKMLIIALAVILVAVAALAGTLIWRFGGEEPNPTDPTAHSTDPETTIPQAGIDPDFDPDANASIPVDTVPPDVKLPTGPNELATEPNENETVPTEPADATDSATEPTEHTHSYTERTVEPACEMDGYTEYTCDCGYSYRDDFVSELPHQWTEWNVTKEPTTKEAGSKTRTCTVCGYVDTVSIPNHVHSYTEKKVEPTCEKDGYILYTCECGSSYDRYNGGYLGHDWSEWEVTVQPTTSSTGQRIRSCSRCKEVVTEAVPALDPDTGEAYESYIDPRIVVTRYRRVTGYDYGDISVADFRDWGDPPSIWINDDGTWTVVYFRQDGTRVEFTAEIPPDGYIRSCRILEDGSYLLTLIGGFNKN